MTPPSANGSLDGPLILNQREHSGQGLGLPLLERIGRTNVQRYRIAPFILR